MLKTIIAIIQIVLITVYVILAVLMKKYIKSHPEETVEKCEKYLSKNLSVRTVLALLIALCALLLVFIR